MLNPLFIVLHLVMWSCIIKESRMNKPLGVGQGSAFLHGLCFSYCPLLEFLPWCPQWWIVISIHKSNEPFPLQAVFCYDAYHSNRKQIRTPNKLYDLNQSLESMVEGENGATHAHHCTHITCTSQLYTLHTHHITRTTRHFKHSHLPTLTHTYLMLITNHIFTHTL